MPETRENMERILAAITDGIVVVDQHGTVLYANQSAEQIFDRRLSQGVYLGIPFRSTESFQDVNLIRRHGVGWAELRPSPITWENHQAYVIGVRDITERKNTEAELRIAATAFESREGMFITDENKLIVRVNRAFTTITGYSPDDLLGKNPNILSSGRHNKNFYSEMLESIDSKGFWEGEIWNRRKNGEIYPSIANITEVKDSSGNITNYVCTYKDITKIKSAQEEIYKLAYYDLLTSLPNRRLLMDRLKQVSASCAQSGKKCALLIIDLENFKSINDTLGRHIGDLLLQQIARRLELCVCEGDTLARMGGDEFGIMLCDIGATGHEAMERAEIVGQKIMSSVNQACLLDSYVCHMNSSIGVTFFDATQKEVEDILRQADIAMYHAKKAGHNILHFFGQKMQDAIIARTRIEDDLRKAFEERQFQLYYQIQMDCDRHPVGVEALIRWLHPDRGLIVPLDFIPIAEQTDLILLIGKWVIETACIQLNAWQQDSLTRDLVLSVNVSAKQFHQAEFVSQVETLVKRYSINPDLFKMELTESVMLEDIGKTISTINALQKVGVRLSLDDFGTGYSSLQYLKNLPLNQVKIDQSFVRDIATDKSDEAIVKSIITLAQNLNINVIAEGVETEDQRQFLLNSGCTRYQGYLFGRPLPIEQFMESLKRGV